MATLTVTAYYTRRAIKYGSILLVFLIFSRVLWVVGSNIYKQIFPPPPPPPTIAFGKLPALPFPERVEKDYNFVLQTPTSEYPILDSQALVYFMPQASSSLLALENATLLAKDLGFGGKATSLSETIYRFEREGTAQSLDINIVNKTFSINYDLTKTPELFATRPRSTVDALQVINSAFSSDKVFPPDLENGIKSFEFLKVDSGSLKRATSLSDATFVRVNFFRKDLPLTPQEKSEVPILTPYKKDGNVWFIVSGDNSRDKSIVGGEYHYFPVDDKRKSTYPLKNIQIAWNELVEGKAFVSQEPQVASSQVIIRRIYLAFFDSGRPQGFLQPIYVFEGDSSFLAYLPAVDWHYYDDPKFKIEEATPSATPE